MPSIIVKMRKQTAVYWALQGEESGGSDYDSHGRPLYTTPVELTVRWEEVNESIILEDGTTYISRATVYTPIDIVRDGVLVLGKIADLESEDDPLSNNGSWSVVRFDKLPNLKVTEFLRTAYL